VPSLQLVSESKLEVKRRFLEILLYQIELMPVVIAMSARIRPIPQDEIGLSSRFAGRGDGSNAHRCLRCGGECGTIDFVLPAHVRECRESEIL